MRIPASIQQIQLDGGHPALDFVNTLHSRTVAEPRDYWTSPADLVAWHQRVGLVEPATADGFAALAPAAAGRLLARARDVRRRLHELFAGVAATRRAPRPELRWLERRLAGLATFRRLEPHGAGVSWVVRPDPAHPASLLASVLFAAAELLTTAELDRIKACPPPHGCGWLFLDASRNGRRVWCSMRACGNTAKVRRFRERSARRE